MNRSYSHVFRLIHWGMAISFTLLLLTIFLRLTWMNKNHVSDIIQTQLTEKGIVLSEDETISLAKQIRKPMWQWHIYLGYVLTGLFALRLTLPFFGEMKFQNPFKNELTSKERFQFGVYIIFYIMVAISLITGLLIEHGNRVWRKSLEEVHELSIYYLIAYIILHMGGVLLAEWKEQPGIISRIFGGKEK